MAERPSLDNYIDVAERVQDFKDKHPHGSLQTIGWEIVTVEGVDPKTSKPVKQTFVVYRAAAYRDETDPAPGHGIAWEPFPGRTPYTKDSELMNAETAAWGRAICATGLVSNRSLASRQEVRNRRADQDAAQEDAKPPKGTTKPPDTEAPATVGEPIPEDVVAQIKKAQTDSGVTNDQFVWMLLSVGVQTLPENPDKRAIGAAVRGLTLEQAFRLEELLKNADDAVPGSGEAA